MKRLALLIILLFMSGCAWGNTGPQNAYLYPDMPDEPIVSYLSPAEAPSNGICVAPADKQKQMTHEIDWEIVYLKMQAVIDAVNRER